MLVVEPSTATFCGLLAQDRGAALVYSLRVRSETFITPRENKAFGMLVLEPLTATFRDMLGKIAELLPYSGCILN